jgi:hypothetical protein
MSKIGLEDPLNTAKVCTSLVAEIEQMGYSITVSSDFEKMAVDKAVARDEPLTPYFDPEVCYPTPERFFWMKVTNKAGATSALQAYRYDLVDTSLAEWGPSFRIGIYMLRKEVLVPWHTAPPKNSIAHRIHGKLVYHGEFWIAPHVRNRLLLEKFSRLGMVLCHVKWNPDAIWGVCNKRMAEHGNPSRMGYPYMEKGFFRWQWTSEDDYYVEWLNVLERQSLEQMISEMNDGLVKSA